MAVPLFAPDHLIPPRAPPYFPQLRRCSLHVAHDGCECSRCSLLSPSPFASRRLTAGMSPASHHTSPLLARRLCLPFRQRPLRSRHHVNHCMPPLTGSQRRAIRPVTCSPSEYAHRVAQGVLNLCRTSCLTSSCTPLHIPHSICIRVPGLFFYVAPSPLFFTFQPHPRCREQMHLFCCSGSALTYFRHGAHTSPSVSRAARAVPLYPVAFLSSLVVVCSVAVSSAIVSAAVVSSAATLSASAAIVAGVAVLVAYPSGSGASASLLSPSTLLWSSPFQLHSPCPPLPFLSASVRHGFTVSLFCLWLLDFCFPSP